MIVAARLLRDRRRSLLWWTLAIAGLVFVNVAFYPSFKDQPSFDQLFEDLPESLKAYFGVEGAASLTSPTGYLHSQVFTLLLPAALLIFAIGLGARAIAGSEDEGTLELLMANPVTRTRVAWERYAAGMGLLWIVGLASFVVTLALSAPFELLEGLSVVKMAAACLAATSLATLHASIAFAVGCAVGGRVRAIGVAATIAVAGYVIFGLVSAGLIHWSRIVSPWWWYLSRNILDRGLPFESVVVPLGLSGILAAAGVWAFTRRDLR